MREIDIKEGEIYISKIYAIGSKGNPLSNHNGYIVIINTMGRKTKIGEKIKYQITSVHNKYAFAIEIEEI